MPIAGDIVRYDGREWDLIADDPTMMALDAEREREEAILDWDSQDTGWVTDPPTIWGTA